MLSADNKKHFQEVKAGLNQQIADLERAIAAQTLQLEAHKAHLEAIEGILAQFNQPDSPKKIPKKE
jgi:hypothetical protein